MLPAWANDEITIITPSWVEERGKQIPDYRNGVRTVVKGCSVQPGGQTENLAGRQAVEVRFTVYAPPGVRVDAHDAVEYEGTLFQVDGGALLWKSPTGSVSHSVMNLVDWEG